MPSVYRVIIAGAVLLVAAGAAVAYWKWDWHAAHSTSTHVPSTSNAQPHAAQADKPVAYTGPIWFTDVTRETGINFVHVSGTSAEKPFPAANGSGLGALDYDGDGFDDLYFLAGTPFPIDRQRVEPHNRIYRNDGKWHFHEVTAQTGLGHTGYSAGVAVGDYNDDGFVDVYVSCYGPDCLYMNCGDGTFQRVEKLAGTADERWGASVAMFDYNRDGYLDIYVGNYAQWTPETNQYCGDRSRGIRIYCSPNSVTPERGTLYRNHGDGTFADASEASGIARRRGRAQGVVAADLNDDGLIDLYVGNDLNANSLFMNRGDETFEDVTEASGAGYDYMGRAQAGMGVDVADVNNDGAFELFVTNFQNEPNTLYLNANGTMFQDVSARYGLAAPSMPWVGWGTVFADFNLDGMLDLVVTNGHVDDNRHLMGQEAPYAQPPLLFRGEPQRFERLGSEGGQYFTQHHVGRGLLTSDLDRDGDQDLAIGHQDAAPTILRNETPHNVEPLVVWVHGTHSNRDAIGSRISLQYGDHVQHRQVKGGGSYLSASSLRQVFAVPKDQPARLIVRWPNGNISELPLESLSGTCEIWEPLDSSSARVYLSPL